MNIRNLEHLAGVSISIELALVKAGIAVLKVCMSDTGVNASSF